MNKNSLRTSPQLENYEQQALALSPKQIHSLYKRATKFDISMDVIFEVYRRGGFARVDSFIHGGQAAILDKDLHETEETRTTDPDLPSSRFAGTPELTAILKSQTPGQQRAETIKRVVRDVINTKKETR